MLYDSKDLVTHALCVGMTGSGKTGLGIALIEEAAIDGVPVIVIDPEGRPREPAADVSRLRADDFAPWVNEDEARRAGQDVDGVRRRAGASAGRRGWPSGARTARASSGCATRRSSRSTRRAAPPACPVSVLTSFARPAIDDPELLRERVQTTVSSLLALAGIDAEPLKSREHMLLSTILLSAWQAGESPDLGDRSSSACSSRR